MKHLLSILCFLIPFVFCIASCKKSAVSLSAHGDEVFWVTNKGADMPVWVRGNTASKVIVLIVHGGPGEGAYDFSDYETARLRQQFGVAYWDQPDAGGASGNANFENLSLPQMVDDLDAVIKVLKYRYNNPGIFLYAHSFGGLLGAAFLVKDANQNQLKGWIEIDGAHNYPLCNELSRRMLIDTGSVQIAKGRNVGAWTSIVGYCRSHDPATSLAVSNQVEAYAHEAESYTGIASANTTPNLFSPEDPMSLFANWVKTYYTNAGGQFIQSLQDLSYSNQLSKVTIPSLLLWGQYDFTVPPDMGRDALNLLGSTYKRLVFFPHSGHRPMVGDTDAVEDEIISFVNQFK